MASPHPNPPTGNSTPQSGGVADPMLFKLATDIAAAHHRAPDGTCASLLCRSQPYPCGPARLAHRAAQQAHHRPAKQPTPAPPPMPPETDRHPARGRAAVPTPPAANAGTSDFTMIGQPTSMPPMPAEPGAAPVFAPFRRPTVPITDRPPESDT